METRWSWSLFLVPFAVVDCGYLLDINHDYHIQEEAVGGAGSTASSSDAVGSSSTSSNSASGAGGTMGAGGAAGASNAGGSGGLGGMGGASSASGMGGTGGMGGSSGAGGAGGMGGAGSFQWTAYDPAPSKIYQLPSWLSYSSNNAQRTSQFGPSTLVFGFAAGQPRPRNVGMGWGLSLESTRTNTIPNSAWSGVGWATGSMMTITAQVDPSGGAGGIRFNSQGNQQSNAIDVTSNAATAWLMGVQGVAPYAHFAYGSSYIDVTSNVWTRYEVYRPNQDMSSSFRLETQDSPLGAGQISGATAVVAFAAQAESGAKYPSSYIPTPNNVAVTRNADSLSADAVVAPGGYFDVVLQFAPNYASGQQAKDLDLLFVDNSTRVYLTSSNVVVLHTVGKSDLITQTLTFSREQQLTVTARSTPTMRQIIVTGATDGNDMVKDATPSVPAAQTPLYVLGNAAGSQECADLRSVVFQNPM